MSTWTAQRSRNPFGLTDRQAEAVQLLVDLGTDKAVAARLGITEESTSRRLCEAQKALGIDDAQFEPLTVRRGEPVKGGLMVLEIGEQA